MLAFSFHEGSNASAVLSDRQDLAPKPHAHSSKKLQSIPNVFQARPGVYEQLLSEVIRSTLRMDATDDALSGNHNSARIYSEIAIVNRSSSIVAVSRISWRPKQVSTLLTRNLAGRLQQPAAETASDEDECG